VVVLGLSLISLSMPLQVTSIPAFVGRSRATMRFRFRSPTLTRNGSFAIFFPCRQAAAFLAINKIAQPTILR
jgi:hypothetical protein